MTLILVLISKVLDYFVAGNELTRNGNFIAGSITDIVRSVADFSTHLDVLLGNHP